MGRCTPMWTGWKRTGQGSERSAAAAGQRRMNGRVAPSMGTEIGRGLTAHALAFTLLSLTGLVLVVFPLARQAHIERQAETPASVAREREGTASLFAVIDEALPRADIKRARAAWHDAYRIALPRGDWQEIAALRDLPLRRGRPGARIGRTQDRHAYLGALGVSGCLVSRAGTGFARRRHARDRGVRDARGSGRRRGRTEDRRWPRPGQRRVPGLRARPRVAHATRSSRRVRRGRALAPPA